MADTLLHVLLIYFSNQPWVKPRLIHRLQNLHHITPFLLLLCSLSKFSSFHFNLHQFEKSIFEQRGRLLEYQTKCLFSASRVERIVGETVASSGMQRLVEVCLFIYGLFNDDISIWGYKQQKHEKRCLPLDNFQRTSQYWPTTKLEVYVPSHYIWSKAAVLNLGSADKRGCREILQLYFH